MENGKQKMTDEGRMVRLFVGEGLVELGEIPKRSLPVFPSGISSIEREIIMI